MNWNRLKIEWNSTELHNRIQVFIVGLGTIIAVIVMVNSCQQLGQMSEQTTAIQGQLAEMKSNSADTKEMVKAATIQAEETRKLATDTHASLTFAKEQAAISMRPYVWPDRMEGLALKAGAIVQMNVFYGNFGNSPAVSVLVNQKMVMGEVATEIALGKYSDDRIKKEILKRRKASKPVGAILLKGDARNWITPHTEKVLTDSDFNYIMTHDGGLTVVLRFEYADTTGNKYITEFCRFRLLTGAWANGASYNHIS